MTFSVVMLLLIGLTTIVVLGALRVLTAAARRADRITFATVEESAGALELAIDSLRGRAMTFEEDLSGRSCST